MYIYRVSKKLDRLSETILSFTACLDVLREMFGRYATRKKGMGLCAFLHTFGFSEANSYRIASHFSFLFVKLSPSTSLRTSSAEV